MVGTDDTKHSGPTKVNPIITRKWIHWVTTGHICKYCGQNLLSPNTGSECPARPKQDTDKPVT